MEYKKLTLYIDTSIIGGYFDREFAEGSQFLIDNLEKFNFDIMYSSVTENELLKAPKQVKELLETIPDTLKKRVELTEEARYLADASISEKVVGKTSRGDCFHIALASIHKVDILVSWNFKHIVNKVRIKGYNAINLKLGYTQIDIRSPENIIYYEK